MPRARDFLTLGRDWFATVSVSFLNFRLVSVEGGRIRSRGIPPRPGGRGGQPLPWSGHIRAAREWPTGRSRDSGRWWAARDTVRRCATLLEPVREGPGLRLAVPL